MTRNPLLFISFTLGLPIREEKIINCLSTPSSPGGLVVWGGIGKVVSCYRAFSIPFNAWTPLSRNKYSCAKYMALGLGSRWAYLQITRLYFSLPTFSRLKLRELHTDGSLLGSIRHKLEAHQKLCKNLRTSSAGYIPSYPAASRGPVYALRSSGTEACRGLPPTYQVSGAVSPILHLFWIFHLQYIYTLLTSSSTLSTTIVLLDYKLLTFTTLQLLLPESSLTCRTFWSQFGAPWNLRAPCGQLSHIPWADVGLL